MSYFVQEMNPQQKRQIDSGRFSNSNSTDTAQVENILFYLIFRSNNYISECRSFKDKIQIKVYLLLPSFQSYGFWVSSLNI